VQDRFNFDSELQSWWVINEQNRGAASGSTRPVPWLDYCLAVRFHGFVVDISKFWTGTRCG
jgi:hypothetical protein